MGVGRLSDYSFVLWLLRIAQLSVQEILKPRLLNGKYAREDTSLYAILFTFIPKVSVERRLLCNPVELSLLN